MPAASFATLRYFLLALFTGLAIWRLFLFVTVNNANKKYRNVAKDAAGNPQATTQEREFYAVDVDADTAKRLKGTPHEGATAMVVRSK